MSATEQVRTAISTQVLRPDHISELLRAWQNANSLPETGMADAATISSIDAKLAAALAPASVVLQDDAPEVVEDATVEAQPPP